MPTVESIHTFAPVPPSSPANPSNPSNPVSPSNPSNPAAPGYIAPNNPNSPLNPGSPSNPSSPSSPASINNPASPSYLAPSSPASPSNPSNPAYVAPTAPASPANPANPANPSNPSYVSPTSPASPLNPSSPSSPSNPASPNYVSPLSPASPSNPSSPSNPANAASPASPVTVQPTHRGQTYTPTWQPSAVPSVSPVTAEPTSVGYTYIPSVEPTSEPSSEPVTASPTDEGFTYAPTIKPTFAPSKKPFTSSPTLAGQTYTPSNKPSPGPTSSPVTLQPTDEGATYAPTDLPSGEPSMEPTSLTPTHRGQTYVPSSLPSWEPSSAPVTVTPTSRGQTYAPTAMPVTISPVSQSPTSEGQTYKPTYEPTDAPTKRPITVLPTKVGQTYAPTAAPSSTPSGAPVTAAPTLAGQTYSPSTPAPSTSPSTQLPTVQGYTYSPTDEPTTTPTLIPTYKPSKSPISSPTSEPSSLAAAVGADSLTSTGSHNFLIILVVILLLLICCIIIACFLYRRNKKVKKVYPETSVPALSLSPDENETIPDLVVQKSAVDDDELEKRVLDLLAKNATAVGLSFEEQSELLNAPMIGDAVIDAQVAEFRQQLNTTQEDKKRLKRILLMVQENGTVALSKEDTGFLAEARATGDKQMDRMLSGAKTALGPLADLRRLRQLLGRNISTLTPAETAELDVAIEMMDSHVHLSDNTLLVMLEDYKRKHLLANVFARSQSTVELNESERAAAESVYRSLRPRIGIAIQENGVESAGVKVVGLAPRGPGELAGLQSNDCIVSINGNPIRNSSDFTSTVALLKPGNFTRIAVIRGGVEIDVGLTMGAQGCSVEQTSMLYKSLYSSPDNLSFTRSRSRASNKFEVEIPKSDATVSVDLKQEINVGSLAIPMVASIAKTASVQSPYETEPVQLQTDFQPDLKMPSMELSLYQGEKSPTVSIVSENNRPVPMFSRTREDDISSDSTSSSSSAASPSSQTELEDAKKARITVSQLRELKRAKMLLKKATMSQLNAAEMAALETNIMSLSNVAHGDHEFDQLISQHRLSVASKEVTAAKTLELMELAKQRSIAKTAEEQFTTATEEERTRALSLLSKMKTRLGLAIEDREDRKAKNVKVVAVVPGGSASLAGLQIGDLICEFNGRVVSDGAWFANEQRNVKAGDDIVFRVLRQGAKLDIIVRMGAQGYTLEQIAKLRKIAAVEKNGMGVVQTKASSHKGAQTNFVKIGVTSDGTLRTNFDSSHVNEPDAVVELNAAANVPQRPQAFDAEPERSSKTEKENVRNGELSLLKPGESAAEQHTEAVRLKAREAELQAELEQRRIQELTLLKAEQKEATDREAERMRREQERKISELAPIVSADSSARSKVGAALIKSLAQAELLKKEEDIQEHPQQDFHIRKAEVSHQEHVNSKQSLETTAAEVWSNGDARSMHVDLSSRSTFQVSADLSAEPSRLSSEESTLPTLSHSNSNALALITASQSYGDSSPLFPDAESSKGDIAGSKPFVTRQASLNALSSWKNRSISDIASPSQGRAVATSAELSPSRAVTGLSPLLARSMSIPNMAFDQQGSLIFTPRSPLRFLLCALLNLRHFIYLFSNLFIYLFIYFRAKMSSYHRKAAFLPLRTCA